MRNKWKGGQRRYKRIDYVREMHIQRKMREPSREKIKENGETRDVETATSWGHM